MTKYDCGTFDIPEVDILVLGFKVGKLRII